MTVVWDQRKTTSPIQITIYVNKYYENNLTISDITIYYYLGDRMVALKKAGTLRYVSQDHLTGTSVTSDTGGNLVAKMSYFPYGATRATTGTIETEKKFTGQRLDSGVDLYYYGARYYDANIGRFISPDTIVSNLRNPQTLNRYSYALNNPLRYIDPSGNQGRDVSVSWGDFGYGSVNVSSTVLDVQDWMGGGSFASQYPEVAAALESALAAQGVTDGSHTVPTVSDNSDGVDTPPTTQNPNTIIANGLSAAPALPGRPTAGVGTSPTTQTSVMVSSTGNVSALQVSGSPGTSGDLGTQEIVVGVAGIVAGTMIVAGGFTFGLAGALTLDPPLVALGAAAFGVGITFIKSGIDVLQGRQPAFPPPIQKVVPRPR